MENQGYEGPTPDPRFYDPDGNSEDKKKEFLRWYEGQKRLERTEGYVFRLRHEMEQYCISEVKLLKAGFNLNSLAMQTSDPWKNV